ncbi:MAG: hypothetical protein GY786_20685 [Proteobacteria bacterium]|nr:hypothetical protein [Pseudomonadota bacterium]
MTKIGLPAIWHEKRFKSIKFERNQEVKSGGIAEEANSYRRERIWRKIIGRDPERSIQLDKILDGFGDSRRF